MVLVISISKQETDFGKSISERTGMYMGITDVTAAGAAPVRVETPQVSGPAPQSAPKPEVKAPAKPAVQSVAQGVTHHVPHIPAPTTDIAGTADMAVRSAAQPEVQKAQNRNLTRAAGEDVKRGQTGVRAAGQQRAERADRASAQDILRAQNGQRTDRPKEEQKSEQESYYEKIMAEKAMENAKERLRSLKYNVQFGYNDEIERYTIKITDADNKEVKKEIPSEEIQKMIEHLHTMKGMMFETEV